MSMKIITWNVNGLRATLGKGALNWAWEQAPDVLCLQEIKVRPEQLKEEQRNFPGYEVVWNPAERAGYSGVATFLRTASLELQLGMNAPLFDTEGRLISTLHPGFRLFNIYFPNGQRGQERLDYKLEFYAHLLALCDRLHASGEHLILTGDFNTDEGSPPYQALFGPVDDQPSPVVDSYRAAHPDRARRHFGGNPARSK